jgi:hypothetical protein
MLKKKENEGRYGKNGVKILDIQEGAKKKTERVNEEQNISVSPVGNYRYGFLERIICRPLMEV